MTQHQPSYQYGRQPQPQGYGGGYPQAPIQQYPQRHTPAPQQGMRKLFAETAVGLTATEQSYPQQPSSPDYPPQRNGPAPFYVVAGQQQPQGPGTSHGQYPPRDATPRIPSNQKPPPLQTSSPQPQPGQYPPMHTSSPPPNQYPNQPPPQSGHRPSSTYSPQELSGDPNSAAYSASLYSQDEAYASAPAPANQQYSAYVPPQQTQQQPGYQPPAPPQSGHIPPPVAMNAGYPVVDARQNLPSQQGQYKPYQRPGTSEGPSAPSAPPGNAQPQDFYRQSTAY
jgi:signal transducing adaptor molecule